MISVKIERDIDAPADRVWSLLANFGNLDWFQGWDKLEVFNDGEIPGMTRRIHMPGMDPFDEILQAIDHDLQQLQYTIPNLPMPVTDYEAKVTLESQPGDKTHIVWECKATPEGIPEADARKLLEDTYGMMIDKLGEAAKQ